MTVAELIEELRKMPQDAVVGYMDYEYGFEVVWSADLEDGEVVLR